MTLIFRNKRGLLKILQVKVQSLQKLKARIPSVTIDDIEFDQPRFQKLLTSYGELVLMDQCIAVARILPPINDQAMNPTHSALENPHVS